jgi:hypothetical protein
VGAVGLRSAVAILLAVSGATLLVSSAHAETETTAATPEAPETAGAGARDRAPDAEQRELAYQRRQEWWAHAREVLFSEIELSAEQSRGVDAIIENQLDGRRRSAEVRAELNATPPQADPKRYTALLAESRALRAELKGPHECIEELRALLSEEQHPTFDLNRARLAAEGQQTRRGRRQRRSQEGAEATPE